MNSMLLRERTNTAFPVASETPWAGEEFITRDGHRLLCPSQTGWRLPFFCKWIGTDYDVNEGS